MIVRFDGREVRDSRDLPRLVAATPVGKAVEVVVVRKAKELTRTVTLGRLEDDDRQASLGQPPAESPNAAAGRCWAWSLRPDRGDAQALQHQGHGQGRARHPVDPNSPAADKRIQPGDVIVEVGQETVSAPADLTRRVEALKKEGRKSVLLLVANAQGEVRFIALPLEG